MVYTQTQQIAEFNSVRKMIRKHESENSKFL
jgi:hypothetical protein